MLKNPETVFVTILLAASVLGIMQSRSQKRNTRRTRIRAIKRELHIRNCLDDAEPETDHAPLSSPYFIPAVMAFFTNSFSFFRFFIAVSLRISVRSIA